MMPDESTISTASPNTAQERPKLLLHCCCAPCSTHVVTTLAALFDVTGYFYGPNMHPSEEYQLRLREMIRLSTHLDIPLVTPPYDPLPWLRAVRGHEFELEGATRCLICYRLRLEATARFAAENGFAWFASTLSVSPHKDAQAINSLGEDIARRFGCKFHSADFKKRDGFKISIQMSDQLGLYRQNHCGCCFSKRRTERAAARLSLEAPLAAHY